MTVGRLARNTVAAVATCHRIRRGHGRRTPRAPHQDTPGVAARATTRHQKGENNVADGWLMVVCREAVRNQAEEDPRAPAVPKQ